MNNYREQIKDLAFTVNDGLTEYITVHNIILKEGGTFRSFLKNLIGRAVPMSELLEDAEKLVLLWNVITEKISSFKHESYSLMNEDERYYFHILVRYARAMDETVNALVETQKLLNERSKGGQGNLVTWSDYRESENKYKSKILKYKAIGEELNNASHIIFKQRNSVKDILSEFNVEPHELKDLLDRLSRVGNVKAVDEIKDLDKLRIVLDIYKNSPSDWTEEDKFIEISNYLEYGKR